MAGNCHSRLNKITPLSSTDAFTWVSTWIRRILFRSREVAGWWEYFTIVQYFSYSVESCFNLELLYKKRVIFLFEKIYNANFISCWWRVNPKDSALPEVSTMGTMLPDSLCLAFRPKHVNADFHNRILALRWGEESPKASCDSAVSKEADFIICGNRSNVLMDM